MSREVSRRPRDGQRGFTLIELLIATTVFSLVLLLITFGVLQITRVYYKGVNETNTQNTTRSILDTLSQSIQFSGVDLIQQTPGNVAGNTYAFCIGTTRYTYVLGMQVTDVKTPPDNQTFHALVQDTTPTCAGPPPPVVANLKDTQSVAGGRELLNKHMRLSKLIVKPVGGNPNIWSITVRVVFGDDDLLGGGAAATGANAECKIAVKGTQFCASSELSTVVVKRVQ